MHETQCKITSSDLLLEYAFGVTQPEERKRVELHLSDCEACRHEVASLVKDAQVLSEAAAVETGEQAAADALWSRIEARLKHSEVQTWRSWGEGSSKGPSEVFEDTAIEGIKVRRLRVSPDGEEVTMIVRMNAGCAFPAHRHGGPEQCYVLSGDLRIADRVLHAGEFVSCETGSEHPVQSTQDGCELLIVSSTSDELLS